MLDWQNSLLTPLHELMGLKLYKQYRIDIVLFPLILFLGSSNFQENSIAIRDKLEAFINSLLYIFY